jgi:hypothetical protein
MPKIIKTRSFKHKGVDYETRATVNLAKNVVRVEIFHDNAPVIVTFRNGSKATRAYDVDLSMRMDLAKAPGCDAVQDMMNTAEADLKAII